MPDVIEALEILMDDSKGGGGKEERSREERRGVRLTYVFLLVD